jgi:protease I
MSHLTGKRVAIIATDFFEEPELIVPRDRLRESGADVRVYASKAEPIQAMQGDTDPTQQVEVDGTFDDVDVDATDVLVVPGGTVNADRIRMEAAAQRLVEAFDRAGKPLALICHGPWLLISAGRASGRRLTSWPSLADDLRNAGATWVDEEVVVDRNLVTSRKPDDLPAFVAAIERQLAG